MPMLIITGYPCSGKTTRANELKTFFESEHGLRAHIISDHNESVGRNDLYSDPKKEKEVRSNLKSNLQRIINKEDVVIVDSLNYIKGFRYELFCVTKSSLTPHCVIHCDVNKEVAREWNKNRPQDEMYSQEVFDALIMRYEAPDSRNRWDSPLFLVHPVDSLPFDDIYNVLYKKQAPRANQSTQSQPLAPTNFLHELDKITNSVVMAILDAQKMCVPGDQISIPGATEKFEFHKHLTLAELKRMRQQFISFVKLRPIEDSEKVHNMFIQFLMNSLRS